MRQGLAAIFTLGATFHPTIVLLEDWHWADEASQEVLQELVGMLPAYPLLVLVTSRPEHSLDWLEPGGHTPINLRPLEASASFHIVRSVLDVQELPDELERLVHERAGGNPFFIEELCRTLGEEEMLTVEGGRAALTRNIESLRLPDTIQAVLQARIDRLDGNAQELLRLASVFGHEFTERVIRHVLSEQPRLDESLQSLKAQGFIQQIRVLPELTLRFKHALTRDAAYESLIPHQRKQLFFFNDTATTEIYTKRLEERLDLLAHHFSQAENWEQAAHYGREAARRAKRLYQLRESYDRLEAALGWLLKTPESSSRQETLIEMLFEHEESCNQLGLRDRHQTVLDELFSLLEPAGDDAPMADLYDRQGSLFAVMGRLDEAESSLDKARSLGRALANPEVERKVLRSLGYLRWQQNRLDEAVEHQKAALAIDRKLGDATGEVRDLMNLAQLSRSSRALEQAFTYLDELEQLNRTVEDRFVEKAAHLVKGGLYRDLGRA
jgi:predicted ATPase